MDWRDQSLPGGFQPAVGLYGKKLVKISEGFGAAIIHGFQLAAINEVMQ